MGDVMDGVATPAQLSALMGLRMRGETVDELAGFAAAMRDRVVKVDAPSDAIDVVGTGGDGSGTFNISTTAALVAASSIPVAKHGNRTSSKSPARPTSSMRSVCAPITTRRRPARRCARSGSRSCSPRTSTRRCATPARRAGDRRPDRVQPPGPVDKIRRARAAA